MPRRRHRCRRSMLVSDVLCRSDCVRGIGQLSELGTIPLTLLVTADDGKATPDIGRWMAAAGRMDRRGGAHDRVRSLSRWTTSREDACNSSGVVIIKVSEESGHYITRRTETTAAKRHPLGGVKSDPSRPGQRFNALNRPVTRQRATQSLRADPGDGTNTRPGTYDRQRADRGGDKM